MITRTVFIDEVETSGVPISLTDGSKKYFLSTMTDGKYDVDTAHYESIKLEQSKRLLVQEVEKHVQSVIDDYNVNNGVMFASVHNCHTYKDVTTYPHQKFCQDIVNFNADVWEKAREIESSVLSEDRIMPTPEEFKLELPVFGG